MTADPRDPSTTEAPPQAPGVLGYAVASGRRRASVIRSVAWFLAGHLSAILIFGLLEGGIEGLIDPEVLLMLLIFVALTTLSFLGSFLLIRPSAHPRRWPPYALAFAAGIVVFVAWMGISSVLFRFVTSLLGPGLFDIMIRFFAGLVIISLCTCLGFMLVYRFTVDRSRHRSDAVEGPL
jgi:hypothetical protein